MMIKLKNLLKESPDNTSMDGNRISWHDNDARAFGYYDDDFEIGNMWRITHDGLFPGITNRADLKYAGRVWLKRKLISFWDYPEPSELPYVIGDINRFNDDGFKIDKTWNIEVVTDSSGRYSKKFIDKLRKETSGGKYTDMMWSYFVKKIALTSIIIPIESYNGSEKVSNKDKGKAHFLSPLLKNPQKVWMHPLFKDLKKISKAEYDSLKTKYKYTENNNKG